MIVNRIIFKKYPVSRLFYKRINFYSNQASESNLTPEVERNNSVKGEDQSQNSKKQKGSKLSDTKPPQEEKRELFSDYSFRQLDLQTSSLFDIPRPKLEPPVHNVLVCTVLLEGVMPDHVEFFSYFARHAALCHRMPCTPIIHMPDDHQHWTVIKGPFVHAKVKENFEKRQYKRVLQIYDTAPETVDKWVEYVRSNMPMGIEMTVDRFHWESPGLQTRLDSQADTIWRQWSSKALS